MKNTRLLLTHSFRNAHVVLCALALSASVPLLAAPQQGTPQSKSSIPSAAQKQALVSPDSTGAEWPRWTGGRYRISPGDVLELHFPFVPEFDQTLVVQPDGYVALRQVGDVRVQGRTVAELREQLDEAYEPIVRNPVFTVSLKEFEKPYFVATGEVAKPGRYDLRGATTLTQALAYAGGPTGKAQMSEVVIFRYHTEDAVTVKQVNVKTMYSKRDLSEDPMLRPGDTIYIPKSTMGKLAPILDRIGLYLNPVDFFRPIP